MYIEKGWIMEEKIIEKEKANFLMKNKDALINNFSSINYMLFNLLISSESLIIIIYKKSNMLKHQK